jgi:hypothetical protein
MTTNYRANGVDLSGVFLPYSTGTTITTGYRVNGVDIGTVYNTYTTGAKSGNTGFLYNGSDLANYFQNISVSLIQPAPTITRTGGTGTLYSGSDASYYYYVMTNTGAGTTTTYRVVPTADSLYDIFMVGGGGYGAFRDAGGGGGGAVNCTFNIVNGTTYYFGIGYASTTTTKVGGNSYFGIDSTFAGYYSSCTGGNGYYTTSLMNSDTVPKGARSGIAVNNGTFASFTGNTAVNLGGAGQSESAVLGDWGGGGGGTGAVGSAGSAALNAGGAGGAGRSISFYAGSVAAVTQTNLGAGNGNYGRGGNGSSATVTNQYGCGGGGATWTQTGSGAKIGYVQNSNQQPGKAGVVIIRIPK